MNAKVYLLALSMAAGSAVPTLVQAQSRDRGADEAPPMRDRAMVEVNFLEPDKFSDLRSTFGQLEAEERYLTELRQYVESTAARRLPPGQRLQLNITDVDMAGEFEPHRGSSFSDTRLVKETYPPRIRLNFQFTDANGDTIAQGERTLTDLTFSQTLRKSLADDPLRHEKALFDAFFRELVASSGGNGRS